MSYGDGGTFPPNRPSKPDLSFQLHGDWSPGLQQKSTPASVASTGTQTTLGDLDFSKSAANTEARLRFKKILPGIINVRTDGDQIYAFRRVQMGYQWESYGPINPVQ